MKTLDSADSIIIKGARQHNLKNISLSVPKNKLVVFTGLSGSGKSSLAFDTIYAEGQRRYVESLSSYARQFLGVMDKPDVDNITGLSPAIAIDQKTVSHNPRSTVGTVTEIYDYLRLLFARIGHPHCPNCGREISRQSKEEIANAIVQFLQRTLGEQSAFVRIAILSPIVRDRKGEFVGLLDNLRAKGYRSVRIDGQFVHSDNDIVLIKTNKHTIDVLIDRLSIDRKSFKVDHVRLLRSRIHEAVEQALALSDGLVTVVHIQDPGFTMPENPKKTKDHIFSERFSCPVCNISLPEIEPRSFSFNSPHGACTGCTGIGSIAKINPNLILNPNLSISEGGILPFAKMFVHDTWYGRIISAVAKTYGIDTRRSLAHLTSKQREILLYGSGDDVYRVSGPNRFGEQTSIVETFSGIVPELMRRYSETESNYVREEIEKYMTEEICGLCNGKRLKKESLTVTIAEKSIMDVTELPITKAKNWIESLLQDHLSESETTIATPIIREIINRLRFLVHVGLEYLTLSRSAVTLAGGETQRIRLASQIGSGLSGVLYVLDEPSIGLHPRDNERLISTLHKLRDLGNTVIVVEHDKEMMTQADWIVDFGPGAGKHGGAVVAQGTPSQIRQNPHSITGAYLSGKRRVHTLHRVLPVDDSTNVLQIIGARHNNLKGIDVQIPLGRLVAVTGVSGSGKSTLIVDTLYPALVKHLHPSSRIHVGEHTGIKGAEHIDKVILIDQSPIGRTPRSNPATYTGAFTPIREIFASMSEAKLRGFKSGRFSFNVKGGRCEACQGEGQRKIEMQFLADIYVTCEVCHGSRYNSETLEVTYRGKNIAEILNMTVSDALEFFSTHSYIRAKLATIVDVGLGYIHLGQSATTLSGGEAQRIKLATELSRRSTGRTCYILDEPTTGLHFADLEKLLSVLCRLVESGNTVVVIEHNLDVIRSADWIIDLGPRGGDGGGTIVGEGPPMDIIHLQSSYTGQCLKKAIQ